MNKKLKYLVLLYERPNEIIENKYEIKNSEDEQKIYEIEIFRFEKELKKEFGDEYKKCDMRIARIYER